jgi:uncharacterized protein
MLLLRIAITCLAMSLPSFATVSRAQTVSLITTPAGSFSNSAGAAIAKVTSEKAKIRMVVQAQASTGFEELEAGTAEFNVGNSFDAVFFVSGTGDYEGQGVRKKVLNLAAMIPYRVAMHVRADSPIKSIADLKGKRVSSGYNAQKTIARIIEAHLASAGLSYKDVVGVPAPNVVRAAEDFKSGRVDVLFFALGSAAVKEASAAVGGLRVLPIDDSPDAIKRIQAILPGAYSEIVSPAPALDGISAPVKLVAFDMTLNVSASVSEDIAYRVVKNLYESRTELTQTFAPFALFDPSKMGKPNLGIDTHPGAIRFYREIGLIAK